MAWSADGAWLVTGDDHGNLIAWSHARAPGKVLVRAGTAIGSVAFSASGKLVAASDHDRQRLAVGLRDVGGRAGDVARRRHHRRVDRRHAPDRLQWRRHGALAAPRRRGARDRSLDGDRAACEARGIRARRRVRRDRRRRRRADEGRRRSRRRRSPNFTRRSVRSRSAATASTSRPAPTMARSS